MKSKDITCARLGALPHRWPWVYFHGAAERKIEETGPSHDDETWEAPVSSDVPCPGPGVHAVEILGVGKALAFLWSRFEQPGSVGAGLIVLIDDTESLRDAYIKYMREVQCI
jgi:hypothetical protein